MVAARRSVVIVIVDHELRFAAFQFAVIGRLVGGASFFCICPTLPAQLFQHLRALLKRHAVVVTFGHDARHVVHGAGYHRFDPLIHSSGI